MLLAATAILVGFIILIWSADLFVAGSAALAKNMGMPPIIIGLTIVSLGTSAPEILVSITAAMADAGTLAIGNALGSNIANIGLVLGTTVLVAPLCVTPNCIRKEFPTLLVVTVAVGLLLLDGKLSRFDGLLMMTALAVILVRMVRSQSHDAELLQDADGEALPTLTTARAWIFFFAGLGLLVISSKMLVWGASTVAENLGVSPLVIGLTVVAVGTSLPELAATVASALRGHTEIAVGNVIGSNLFNLLAVMSIPGLISPLELAPEVLYRDYAAMTCATVLLGLFMLLGRWRSAAPAGHAYIGRSAGALLLGCYGLYYYWLAQTI